MKSIFTIVACVLGMSVTAQEDMSPRVMLIGEMDAQYEQMVSECSSLLLTVSDNSMEVAFGHWTAMLSEMEASAADQGLDIKGAKLWMNLFWNADGSIRNIYYYPKPTSKNMDFEQLTAFLNDFASSYIFPVSYESCYSHYGSATFPVRRRVNVEAK